MDWEKEMLSQISLYDIYQGFRDSEMYQKLMGIGDELYPATQYGNVYIVEDDPFSSAILQIISTSYFLGVASFIQLEQGLYLNEGCNLEYPYAITLRSMIEVVGRVHKGIRLYKTYQRDQNTTNFFNGSRRLIISFDVGGYNVLTLVDSLKDKIKNIKEEYDTISDYLHGDVIMHAVFRKMTYLHAPNPPKDVTIEEAMSAIKVAKKSPFIERYVKLVESLREVLLDDLEIAQQLAKPFADRYKQKNKISSQ